MNGLCEFIIAAIVVFGPILMWSNVDTSKSRRCTSLFCTGFAFFMVIGFILSLLALIFK